MAHLERIVELDWRSYRLTVAGNTIYLHNWSDGLGMYETYQDLVGTLLADAEFSYKNYTRRCPGRDTAEQNIARYKQILNTLRE